MQLNLTKGDIEILISSIISYELSNKNKTYFPLLFDLHKEGDLTKPPFGCDSLSLISLATAVDEYFGVSHSGLEDNFIRYPNFKSWVQIVYDSQKHYSEGITFSTSGTTGKPTKVFHNMDGLEKEASYLAKLLDGSKSISAFVRPHHIYGFLYTIALPKYLDVQITFHEPIPSESFFKIPSDSLLVATPTLYDIVIKKDKTFNPNICAVSSTEPLSIHTKDDLKAKGIKKVVEFYGSSQSLGVGYKFDDQEHFRLFEYLDKTSVTHIQDQLQWVNQEEFSVCSRLDKQVKHRGYLVDLDQYKQKLESLDAIKECDLVLSKGKLVAFITPKSKKDAIKGIAQVLQNQPDSIVWTN